MIPFEEAATTARTKSTLPIRELGLTITGTILEPIIAQFEKERLRAGITRVRPRYYLSTEWGVPEATVAIAIPFYLVRPELTLIHAEHACHVEGGARPGADHRRHQLGHGPRDALAPERAVRDVVANPMHGQLRDLRAPMA